MEDVDIDAAVCTLKADDDIWMTHAPPIPVYLEFALDLFLHPQLWSQLFIFRRHWNWTWTFSSIRSCRQLVAACVTML